MPVDQETSIRSARDSLLHDLTIGFAQTPPSIPPKWFYDERGSELFEAITRLPEYYPTEAERTLLVANASEIVGIGRSDTLIELGAGISDKTTALLDAMEDGGAPLRYVPFDISGEAIEEGSQRLYERYDGIEIQGVVGDIDHDLGEIPSAGRRLVALLGGTIGNYEPVARDNLLRSIASTLGPDDFFLLGTDRVKDAGRLVAAYDDAAGVTADFNRNVISVIATLLDTDVKPADFDHRAVWNAEEEWIEMHLVANTPVELSLPTFSRRLEPGDHILTEISAKFTPERLRSDLEAAGLEILKTWTDGDYTLSLSTLSDAIELRERFKKHSVNNTRSEGS